MKNDLGPTYLTALKLESNFPVKNKEAPRKRKLKTKGIVTQVKQIEKFDKKIKNEFLNYLIEDQTKFANINEIENYYYGLLLENSQKYNRYKLEIIKKEKEYEALLQEIEAQLLINQVFDQSGINDLYNKAIDKIKNKIRLLEHSLECYQMMYKRAYKTNYLLKKKIEEVQKYDKEIQKQYEKYEILNNHALLTVKNQSTILKNVQNFYSIAHEKYKHELAQKTALFNTLDFQVITLKNDTSLIQVEINKIKYKQESIQESIKFAQRLNKKIESENRSVISEYYSTKYKMTRIYQALRMTNLDDAIKQFNNLQNQYCTFNSIFQKLNSDIAVLNIKYTELNNKYKEIVLKINLTKKNFNFDESKVDTDVILIQEKKRNINLELVESRESAIEMEQFLKILMMFMINYINKIYTSMRNSYTRNYFTLSIHIDREPAFQNFFNYNEQKKEYQLKFEELFSQKNFNVDNSFGRFLCILLNDYYYALYIILSNSFNLVSADHLESRKDNDQKKFEVTVFKTPGMINLYENNVQLAFGNYEKKAQIYRRSQKEIFKASKKEDKKSIKKFVDHHFNGQKFTMVGDLYNDFLMHCNDSHIKCNSFIRKYPQRSISSIKRFLNDSVIDPVKVSKYQIKCLKKSSSAYNLKKIPKKAKEIDNSTNLFSSVLSETERRMDTIEKEYNYEEDTELDEAPKVHIKKKQNTKIRSPKYMMVSNDLEKVKLYERMNDIRKLELNYYQDLRWKKVHDETQFNEIYFQIKKKFLRHSSSTKSMTRDSIESLPKFEKYKLTSNSIVKNKVKSSISTKQGMNATKKTATTLNQTSTTGVQSNFNCLSDTTNTFTHL